MGKILKHAFESSIKLESIANSQGINVSEGIAETLSFGNKEFDFGCIKDECGYIVMSTEKIQ